MTDFVKNANRLNELLQSAEDRLTRHNTTPSFVATMPIRWAARRARWFEARRRARNSAEPFAFIGGTL